MDLLSFASHGFASDMQVSQVSVTIDAAPLTQKVNVNQVIPYDYEHFVRSIIEYLQAAEPTNFRDFLETNAARVLIDAIAFEFSHLAYMSNANAKQLFIPTATTRRAMYLLGRMLNYTMRAPTASLVDLKFSVGAAPSVKILIPLGTQVRSSGSTAVVFETTSDIEIDVGETEVEVSAIQGVTVIETVGTTASGSYQKFLTNQTSLAENILVWVDGIPWARFDSLYDMEADDLGYLTKFDDSGFVEISFGDGTYGSVPASGKSVLVTYRNGGGPDTNVGVGKINEILSTIVDDSGASASVSVTNEAAASGGNEEESIEEARINIPRSLRASDRLVNQEDFQAIPTMFLDETYGTVFKTNASSRYSWGSLLYVVYVLTTGTDVAPALPSEDLKEALREWVEDHSMVDADITIEAATLLTINITGTIYYNITYRMEDVQANVLAALKDFFAYETREIGDGVKLSEIYAAINSAEGVIAATKLTSPTNDLTALANEFYMWSANLTYVRT